MRAASCNAGANRAFKTPFYSACSVPTCYAVILYLHDSVEHEHSVSSKCRSATCNAEADCDEGPMLDRFADMPSPTWPSLLAAAFLPGVRVV